MRPLAAVLLVVLVAMLGCQAAETTVAFDDKADLDEWKMETPGWGITDGALLQPSASAGRTMIWLPTQAYGDIDVSVEYFIYPVGDGVRCPGLVFRAQDQENYYYIHFDFKYKQVVWVRSAPGNEWTDARRHRPIDKMKLEQWQTIRVVCKGDEQSVYLDGELLFTERDSTLKAGIVGLRTGEGKIAFRNLKINGEPAELEKPFTVKPPKYLTVCEDAGAGAYEAFPDVCRAKSGELLCVFYAGYGHVAVPTKDLPNGGRVSMCRSTDEGKTWSPAEVVVDSAIDDRDPSITQLSNGDLLVTYMTYDLKRAPGTHQVFTVRSSDGGKTWGEPQRVPTPFTQNEAISEPAREMPDGRLLLPVYGAMDGRPGREYLSGVLESSDMGKTWSTLATMDAAQYTPCEPTLVLLPEGRLYMHVRPTMTWTESTDGGKTWTDLEPLGINGHAPYLLLTSKNILLSAFRHPPTTSTSLAYSLDFGKTWSEPVLLDKVIGGYPSMVELSDGRILVVYYTEGGGSDIRCVFVSADREGVTVLEP